MLSLSTSTLLRMTANRATRMYVRLMSNTMDVPETNRRAMNHGCLIWKCTLQVGLASISTCMALLMQVHTFKLLVQVVHISDETVIGEQEAHSGQ